MPKVTVTFQEHFMDAMLQQNQKFLKQYHYENALLT